MALAVQRNLAGRGIGWVDAHLIASAIADRVRLWTLDRRLAAAARRLGEEMGFACPLEPLGTIRYRAELNDGMIEHELVHIFRGLYDGPVAPDPFETDGYQWAALDQVKDDVAAMPQRFSAWFRQYVDAQWPMALARPVTRKDRDP